MKKSKILVVDDSKTYLAFARAALEDAGHTVIQSQDIWISRQIRTESPDLILMDVSLGPSRGTCAVSAVKKWNFSHGIKIYLHSAESAETLSELTQSCGADGYIRKDGNAMQLARKVNAALNHSSAVECSW